MATASFHFDELPLFSASGKHEIWAAFQGECVVDDMGSIVEIRVQAKNRATGGYELLPIHDDDDLFGDLVQSLMLTYTEQIADAWDSAWASRRIREPDRHYV